MRHASGKTRQPRAGWIDALALMSMLRSRDVTWSHRLRGTGARNDPRAAKKYDGERLRALRAVNGVGRPPHKRKQQSQAAE